MRVFFGATLACAALVAALGCAAQDAGDAAPSNETPTGPAETGSADCPTDSPQTGAECTQPEGTTCAVGACGSTYVACRSGRWVVSSDAVEPHCPTQVTDGADCPRCFPESFACSIGCGDGGTHGVRAYCIPNDAGGLTWKVEARTCPTFDAATPDAEAADGS